jgi:hypothetical protein
LGLGSKTHSSCPHSKMRERGGVGWGDVGGERESRYALPPPSHLTSIYVFCWVYCLSCVARLFCTWDVSVMCLFCTWDMACVLCICLCVCHVSIMCLSCVCSRTPLALSASKVIERLLRICWGKNKNRYSRVQITWLIQKFGRQEAAFVEFCSILPLIRCLQKRPRPDPLLSACLPKFLGRQVVCTRLCERGAKT